MDSLNDQVEVYTRLLAEGNIQKAYKGIVTFMSALRALFAQRFEDCAVGALYQGYMDMTYFACTPPTLKTHQLKIAVVYLHEDNALEVWLAGANRSVQADFIRRVSGLEISDLTLHKVAPGEDAIVSRLIAQRPDFDRPEALTAAVEDSVRKFIARVETLLAL